jgi:hypothetical protein
LIISSVISSGPFDAADGWSLCDWEGAHPDWASSIAVIINISEGVVRALIACIADLHAANMKAGEKKHHCSK